MMKSPLPSLLPELPGITSAFAGMFTDAARMRTEDDDTRLDALADMLHTPRDYAATLAGGLQAAELSELSAPDMDMWPLYETMFADARADMSKLCRLYRAAAFYAETQRARGTAPRHHFLAGLAAAQTEVLLEQATCRNDYRMRTLLKYYTSAFYDAPASVALFRLISVYIDTEQEVRFARAAASAVTGVHTTDAPVSDAVSCIRSRASSVLLPTLPDKPEADPKYRRAAVLAYVRRARMFAILGDSIAVIHHLQGARRVLKSYPQEETYHTLHRMALLRVCAALYHYSLSTYTVAPEGGVEIRDSIARLTTCGTNALKDTIIRTATILSKDYFIKDTHRKRCRIILEQFARGSESDMAVAEDAGSAVDSVRAFRAFTGKDADAEALVLFRTLLQQAPTAAPLRGYVILCDAPSAFTLASAAAPLLALSRLGYSVSGLYTDVPSSSDAFDTAAMPGTCMVGALNAVKARAEHHGLPVLLLSVSQDEERLNAVKDAESACEYMTSYHIYPHYSASGHDGAARFDAHSISCVPSGKPYAVSPAIMDAYRDSTPPPVLTAAASRRFAVTLSAMKKEEQRLLFLDAAPGAEGRAWVLHMVEAARAQGMTPLFYKKNDETCREYAHMARLGATVVPEHVSPGDIASFLDVACLKDDPGSAVDMVAAGVPVVWCDDDHKRQGMPSAFLHAVEPDEDAAALCLRLMSLTPPAADMIKQAGTRLAIRAAGADRAVIHAYATLPDRTKTWRPARLHKDGLRTVIDDDKSPLRRYIQTLL